MKKKIVAAVITATALVGCTKGVPECHAEVIFVGGTGATVGPSVPVSTGFTTPFGLPQSNSVGYDGAPWANPQTSVPLVLNKIGSGTTVMGLSKGAQVAMGTEALDTNPNTTYVYIGNPDGKGGLSRSFGFSPAYHEPTHNVINVRAEYDGVADWPDRPLNLLADANALAGWVTVHTQYGTGSANDPLLHLNEAKPVVTQNSNGTTTTDILIGTHDLPLTEPLRAIGIPTQDLDSRLRPLIDAGYSRKDKTTPIKKKAPQKVSHKTIKKAGHHGIS